DAEWFTELLNARGAGTFTVADALERIDVMTKTIETTGIGALVLRKRLDREALGYTALVVGHCSLDAPELAYELLPRAHDQGNATSATPARRTTAARWSGWWAPDDRRRFCDTCS